MAKSRKGAARRIAFQGEPGAYSHLSCKTAYPDYEPVPCASFEEAFAAVSTRRSELAMIPIENSVAGRVADVHNLLPHAELHIVGEQFHRVEHHLLAVPGASLRTIRTVHSHVHALGQCRNIIRRLGLKAVVAADTAGAAAEVARGGDKTRAAIASSLAGEIYGLTSLRKNIEDAQHNTTRFIVLSRRTSDPDPAMGKVITTFVFRVRNIPAALYKALGGFATNGVNMTKLESYMVGGRFAATFFYADVEGHPGDPPLKRALEELRFFCDEMRILGSYHAHPFRSGRPAPGGD